MRRLSITVGLLSLIAVSGCGTSAPHGYFDMAKLASAIKDVSVGPVPYDNSPSKVTCAKSGALEAACVLTFHSDESLEEAAGTYRKEESHEARFNQTATIAPDGDTYEVNDLIKEGE